ncbi:fucose-1-phosphate guanylyltransferase-like [Stegodyphus dumicola]|uniref:fucose-1-phosphate guanylyltransferase-like n=1 Tax=Stegodyphus dumicola TaxID=202533 RepID=UPI0015ADF52D|nr:fucose-1-phosphate guanylyltransferase-like [Stegodyphus dumicola]
MMNKHWAVCSQEVLFLINADIWTFKNEGFTALAHPSPVHIGTSHGVYILPENQDLGNNSTVMSECLRVLQKPSVHEMYDKRAVLKSSCLAGMSFILKEMLKN